MYLFYVDYAPNRPKNQGGLNFTIVPGNEKRQKVTNGFADLLLVPFRQMLAINISRGG